MARPLKKKQCPKNDSVLDVVNLGGSKSTKQSIAAYEVLPNLLFENKSAAYGRKILFLLHVPPQQSFT
jgi:hypothetical protein